MQVDELTKGYLIVASRDEIYYSWATKLLGDIKDFYPEAKVCLVTEERFLDSRADEADEILICDDNYRAKMWGMANTPWDITFYMDADMECMHEDISKVFDELDDNDMMFTGLPVDRWYIFGPTEFPGGTFTLCGAVCLYRKTPIVIEFMQDWYEYYNKQRDGSWWPDEKLYPKHLSVWDQFTLWWLTNKEEKYKDLKIEIFEDDLKWNYWSLLDRKKQPLKEDVVLLHLSCQASRKISEIKYDGLS
jgi:hypothetical protein